jgi:hypothetical protein
MIQTEGRACLVPLSSSPSEDHRAFVALLKTMGPDKRVPPLTSENCVSLGGSSNEASRPVLLLGNPFQFLDYPFDDRPPVASAFLAKQPHCRIPR